MFARMLPSIVVGLGLCSGCDLIPPAQVTVTLTNTSADFDVDATIFFDDEDDLPRDLLIEVGQQRDFTIPPGESVSFSADCDALRAIVLEDADLRVVIGVSPETDSGVLRDGDDFECGDEIVFTFTHSILLVDFDVDVTVR